MSIYDSLRYVNDIGGIQARRASSGVSVYLEPGTDIHRLAVDGQFGPITEYTPPPPVITEAMVRAEADRRLSVVSQGYGSKERETWSEQLRQAKAYQADSDSATPLLDGIASGRGITRAAMAQIIIDKAAIFAASAGEILGRQAVILATDPLPADYTADTHWSAS